MARSWLLERASAGGAVARVPGWLPICNRHRQRHIATFRSTRDSPITRGTTTHPLC
jgi:hypothetical protein